MAQKKKQTRRTPRSSTPRMYGNGAPAQTTTTATQSSTRAVATTTTAGRPAATGGRGSIPLPQQYAYVMGDLKRLSITAAALFAFLIALGFLLR